jgi:hypothetical protein
MSDVDAIDCPDFSVFQKLFQIFVPEVFIVPANPAILLTPLAEIDPDEYVFVMVALG